MLQLLLPRCHCRFTLNSHTHTHIHTRAHTHNILGIGSNSDTFLQFVASRHSHTQHIAHILLSMARPPSSTDRVSFSLCQCHHAAFYFRTLHDFVSSLLVAVLFSHFLVHLIVLALARCVYPIFFFFFFPFCYLFVYSFVPVAKLYG